VKRGEHGLSFQGFIVVGDWAICAIKSLDPYTRIGVILEMNGFDFWHQEL